VGLLRSVTVVVVHPAARQSTAELLLPVVVGVGFEAGICWSVYDITNRLCQQLSSSDDCTCASVFSYFVDQQTSAKKPRRLRHCTSERTEVPRLTLATGWFIACCDHAICH